MKITIEWEDSYSAKLTIDSQEMTVESKPGEVSLLGIEGSTSENTLGGLFASELFSTISKLQQAQATLKDAREYRTWEVIEDEDLLEEIADALW